MTEILKAEIRKSRAKESRKRGKIPAVLYGPSLKNLNLEVEPEEFEKTYKKVGSSSMITLLVDKKKFLVLIQAVQRDPISDKFLHVDFFQPSLKEEIEARIPLVFEGEAPAVKELGGTLVRNFAEIEIKSLPQHLPHEIRVDISKLKTFEDIIFVKDIPVPENVKILRNREDIVAFVARPEKVEEELAKPTEEKVEEVEVIKKGKIEEETKETQEKEK